MVAWILQKDDLQRVMDFLLLKEHHARTLLIHYRWDADKVFAVFVEKGKEQLYGEAGVLGVESNNLSSFHSFTEITCQICYEELPSDKVTTMECGHCFCNECKNIVYVSLWSLLIVRPLVEIRMVLKIYNFILKPI